MRIGIVAALIAVLAVSAQAYRLTLKSPVGVTRTYANTMTINGASETMGMTIPMHGTVSMTMTEQVTSANADGTANIATTLKNGAMQMTISGLPGGESQQINQSIPDMTMTYTQSARGVVSNLQMSGKMTEMPGFPSTMMNGMSNPMQGMAFPDRDLQIGESWTGQETMEIMPGQTFIVNANYTLAGVDKVDGKELLRVTSTATANMPACSVNAGNMPGGESLQMMMSMTMRMTGTTHFDAAAGELYSSNYTGTVTTTITPSGEMAMMGTTMTMNLTGTMQKQ